MLCRFRLAFAQKLGHSGALMTKQERSHGNFNYINAKKPKDTIFVGEANWIVKCVPMIGNSLGPISQRM